VLAEGNTVVLQPGDSQTGDTVTLQAEPTGGIELVGLQASAIAAVDSVVIDAGSTGTAVDLTGNPAGTNVIVAGSSICIRGTVLLDPGASLASITEPDASNPCTPPPPSSSAENHYACYQVKHKLATEQSGTISNQVEPVGTFAKCKLKFLCVATERNGEAIVDPDLHYCCHQCKGGKPAVSFTITDQFVAGAVTTKKLKLMCNRCTVLP
jgi:hypothetical protein